MDEFHQKYNQNQLKFNFHQFCWSNFVVGFQIGQNSNEEIMVRFQIGKPVSIQDPLTLSLVSWYLLLFRQLQNQLQKL